MVKPVSAGAKSKKTESSLALFFRSASASWHRTFAIANRKRARELRKGRR